MNIKRNYREWLIIIIFSFSSCVPILHTKELVVFNNCTTDTVYIGVSYYDYIDSVYEQAYPHYNFTANNRADTTGISLWKRMAHPINLGDSQDLPGRQYTSALPM